MLLKLSVMGKNIVMSLCQDFKRKSQCRYLCVCSKVTPSIVGKFTPLQKYPFACYLDLVKRKYLIMRYQVNLELGSVRTCTSLDQAGLMVIHCRAK